MKVRKTLTATGALILSVSLLTGFAGPAVTPTAVAAGVSSNKTAVTETYRGPAVAEMDDSEVFAAVSNPTSFKDLPKSHWAYTAIMNAVQKGYFKGYDDGTFKPSAPVTREEFAVLLSRVSTNQAGSGAVAFPDVKGKWSEQGIIDAINKGFINPSTYAVGFKPTQAMTRIEMVRWMANGLSAANPEYAQAIKDMAETVLPVKEYYAGTLNKADYGVIGLMVGTGIMNGYENGQFGSTNTTSRAEVASILLRLEEVQKKSPDDFFNLRQMRELGTQGINAETMGYKFDDSENGMTFKNIIQGKKLSLKNNAGSVVMHHVIIIDPNNTNSIYYPLFFGEGSNVRNRIGEGGYLTASLITVTPNRDNFTTKTLSDASTVDILGGGGYSVGKSAKYGHPTIEYKLIGTDFKKGVSRKYYDVNVMRSPKEMIKDENYGVIFRGDSALRLRAKLN